MNNRRLFVVLLVLVAAAIPIGEVLAKGIVSVTISGPGLKTEIEVTDPDTNEALAGLTGGRVFARPEVGDTFYQVAIDFGDPATGEVFATNVYHFYPDPQGGRGYVLFTRVEGGSSSGEGEWYRAASAGEQALHKILAGHGISLAGGKNELPAKEVDTSSSTSKSAVAPEQPVRQSDSGSTGSAPTVAEPSDPASAGPDDLMMMAAVGGIAILLVGGTLLIRRKQEAQA